MAYIKGMPLTLVAGSLADTPFPIAKWKMLEKEKTYAFLLVYTGEKCHSIP